MVTRFECNRPDIPIRTIEFADDANTHLVFFYVTGGSSIAEAKSWLHDHSIPTDVIGESTLRGGRVLVGHAVQPGQVLLEGLAAQGFHFNAPEPEKKKFNPWKMRGNLSMVGQSLQIASSALREKFDVGTATFAISNILANLSNIFLGSQKSKDPHHLRELKSRINAGFTPLTDDPSRLPGLNESRLEQHGAREKVSGFKAFMRRYSVQFGEVGLRMFGAFNLTFPIKFKEIFRGNFADAKLEFNHNDKPSAYVGIAYMVGKVIALLAKAPDPYNPKPKTNFDKIREKYLFKTSSVIEGAAAAFLAYNRFTSPEREIKKTKLGFGKEGEVIPDIFGGTGGLLFTTGLGIRYFAPFGEREVDMEELRAHIVDGIAALPEATRAQALAEAAGTIANHFGKDKLSYGEFYKQLWDDLARFHQLEVRAEAASDVAGQDIAIHQEAAHNSPAASARHEPTLAPGLQEQPDPVGTSFAHDQLKKPRSVELPAMSHQAKLQAAPTQPTATLSAA
jgi:hypothetical protein